MSNTILTLDMITLEALDLFLNSNALIKSVNRQYQSEFARTGAKIGETLRIRLPADFTVRTGPTAAIQGLNQVNTALTVASQAGVDLAFTSVEQTMELDEFSDLILKPAVNVIAGQVASTMMAGAEAVCNMVPDNISGSTISTPDAATWLSAGAYLDDLSAPRRDRMAILAPRTQARTVSSLSGLFNPTGRISQQYDDGEMMGPALGIGRWMSDQTIINHTGGASGTGGLPTVNGANQSGTTINVTAVTSGSSLAVGDIITFAGVYGVNRVTKQSRGELAQFTVTAAYVGGTGTTISIYPALTPASSGNAVQYQTVNVSPASGAAITAVNPLGVTYRKNLVIHPQAVTFATVDLPEYGKGIVASSRKVQDGISLRVIQAYDIQTDQLITRLDVLYGWAWVRPEWGVVVADAL